LSVACPPSHVVAVCRYAASSGESPMCTAAA
jgi:hypothetical protein